MVVAVPGDIAPLQREYPQVAFLEHSSGISARVWDRKFADFLPRDIDVLFQPGFTIPAVSGNQKLVLNASEPLNPQYFNFRDFITGRFPVRLYSSGMVRDGIVNRRNLRDVWRITAGSAIIARQLINCFGYPEERIQVISSGPDPLFCERDSSQSVVRRLARFGLSKGQYLLYVGGMVYSKNVSRLVSAYALLDESLKRRYPLVLVGRGYWRKRLEKCPGQGVLLLDSLGNRDLKALYQGGAAVVFPSIIEDAALPVFEGAMLGAPVGLSALAGNRRTVCRFARLFDPYSEVSIRNALQDLLRQPEKWKISSEELQRIRREYSCSAAAVKYMELFREGGGNGGMQEVGQSLPV